MQQQKISVNYGDITVVMSYAQVGAVGFIAGLIVGIFFF